VNPLPVFKTGAFNHSATLPEAYLIGISEFSTHDQNSVCYPITTQFLKSTVPITHFVRGM
jgi:hypothetical protein